VLWHRIGQSLLTTLKNMLRGDICVQALHSCGLHVICGLGDYISHRSWERLRIAQEELERVPGEKEAWGGPLLNRPGPG